MWTCHSSLLKLLAAALPIHHLESFLAPVGLDCKGRFTGQRIILLFANLAVSDASDIVLNESFHDLALVVFPHLHNPIIAHDILKLLCYPIEFFSGLEFELAGEPIQMIDQP